MSAALIEQYSRDESHKKLAVRLRLKRSSKSSQLSPELGPINKVLKNSNMRLSKNIDGLSELKIEPLNRNLKKYMQQARKYFEEQELIKSGIISKVIKKLRSELKLVHKQLQNIANRGEGEWLNEEKQNEYKDLRERSEEEQDGGKRGNKKNQIQNREISETEPQILQLKQILMQKQNELEKCKEEISEKNNQIKNIREQLIEKSNLLAILQEQIIGYQNKIESQQAQINSLRKHRLLNLDQYQYQSQDHIDHTQDPDTSVRQVVLNSSKSEDESSILTAKQKQMRAGKLQQIFEKTEEALKKYRLFEKQMGIKQTQYAQFSEKICKILQSFNLASREEIKNAKEQDLSLIIYNKINEKLEKVREQFRERESSLESMVNMHLDLALSAIETQVQNLGQVPPHFTVVDKIQYLREVVEYIIMTAAMPPPKEDKNMLQIIENKLEQIMNKSQKFKMELTQKNKQLDHICQKFEYMPEVTMETWQKLQQMEDLLQYNMEALQKEGVQDARMVSSRNSEQASNYLQQLQATIRRIEQKQSKSHEKCLEQKQKLQIQIQELLKFNENLTFKIQQVILQLSNFQEDQDVKSIEKELMFINSRLKQNTSRINKDLCSATNLLLSEERFNLQLENIKAKYSQEAPNFIETMMRKLKEMKQSMSQQKLFEGCDYILRLMQQRDDSIREQLRRRREVLKQRSAVIAQLCKQGMRDSSQQNSMRESN